MSQEQLFIDPASEAAQKSSKKGKRKWILLLVVLVVIGAIMLRGKNKQEEVVSEPVAKKIETVTLGEETTQFATLEKTVKVTSQNEAQIFAEYSGRLQEVNFKVGDSVKAGQILAKFDQGTDENTTLIDLSTANSGLNLARENLDSTEDSVEKDIKIAKNNVEIAKINLKKAEKGEEGAMDVKTAKETLEQAKRQRDKIEIVAEQQIDAAENTLDNARAGVQKATVAHNKTIIRAPISGIVTRKNIASDAAYLTTGSLIAAISTNNNLQAQLDLTAEEAAGLKEGDEVQITCKNAGQDAGQALVAAVASLPNASNLRYSVTLDFPESEAPVCISANQFVQVQFDIPASTSQQKFFLPLEAVRIGQSKNTVFVVEDKVAHPREVTVGQVFGEYIEVTAGLQSGEMIATAGSRNLQEGDEVTSDELEQKSARAAGEQLQLILSSHENTILQ